MFRAILSKYSNGSALAYSPISHVPQKLQNLFFNMTTTKSIPTAAVNTSILIILESTMTFNILEIDWLLISGLPQQSIILNE